MRSWMRSDGKVVTEEQIRNHEFMFPIADGYAFYRVKAITKRGKDPVLTMHKVPNHPENPDNYGAPELFHRLSSVIGFYLMDQIFKK